MTKNMWQTVTISILTLLAIGAGSAVWNHEGRLSRVESTIESMADQVNALHEHFIGKP